MINPDIFHTLIYSLGWTILHSLWQFSLLAVLLGLYIQLMPRQSAARRYTVAFSCLLLGTLAAVITFWTYFSPTGHEVGVAMMADAVVGQQLSSTLAENLAPSKISLWHWLDQNVVWVSVLWALGFVVLSVRYGLAFIWMQRLRRQQLSAVSEEWQATFTEMLAAAGIRNRVLLRNSALVNGPLTLGFYKPIVLVPLGFFTQLAPAQAEAVLLHEIAHIRRFDYLFNLLQTTLQIFFFYHPAVWFITKVIDTEREHACDDYALARTGDAEAYARTLGFLQLHFSSSQNQMAMHFMRNQSSVLARLQRLLQPAAQDRHLRAKFLSPLVLLLISATLVLFQVWGGAQTTPMPVEPAVAKEVTGTTLVEAPLPLSATEGVATVGSIPMVEDVPEGLTLTATQLDVAGKLVELGASESPHGQAVVAPLPDGVSIIPMVQPDSIPDAKQLEKQRKELQEMRKELARERELLRQERLAMQQEREERRRALAELREQSEQARDLVREKEVLARQEHARAEGQAMNRQQKERAEQIARELAQQSEQSGQKSKAQQQRRAELAQAREQTEQMRMAQQQRRAELAEAREQRYENRNEAREALERSARIRREERMAMQEARASNTEAFKEKLWMELTEDGLINNQKDRFTLEIIKGQGTINGKALTPEQTAKYSAIMDEYGMAKEQKRTITMTPTSFSKNSSSNDEQ